MTERALGQTMAPPDAAVRLVEEPAKPRAHRKLGLRAARSGACTIRASAKCYESELPHQQRAGGERNDRAGRRGAAPPVSGIEPN